MNVTWVKIADEYSKTKGLNFEQFVRDRYHDFYAENETIVVMMKSFSECRYYGDIKEFIKDAAKELDGKDTSKFHWWFFFKILSQPIITEHFRGFYTWPLAMLHNGLGNIINGRTFEQVHQCLDEWNFYTVSCIHDEYFDGEVLGDICRYICMAIRDNQMCCVHLAMIETFPMRDWDGVHKINMLRPDVCFIKAAGELPLLAKV